MRALGCIALVSGLFAISLGACGNDSAPKAETETDDGSACPIGMERCPCTEGGACDSGLECLSMVCVDPGGEPSSTSTSDANTTSAVTVSTSTGVTESTDTITTTTDSGTTGSGTTETGTTTTGNDACVRRVDHSAAAGGDGLSWASAFRSVQDAIDDAAASSPCDVWVAAGSYYIYETAVTDTLTLAAGVHVYGGFAGTETMQEQRDWTTNVTALDGRAGPASLDRVYHVVTAAGDARLDGFVITQGSADGAEPDDRGAGIYSDGSDVTIANCSIVDNSSGYVGGGISINEGAPVIIDSIIADNVAGSFAGGMWANESNATVSRCVVHGNTSSDDAAGFVLRRGAPVVENSVFYLNNGGDFGGAIDVWQQTTALVVNNTFYDNDGPHGGGGISIRSDLATVSNNVALANTGTYGPDVLIHTGYTPTVTDNCYPGALPNNIDGTPTFVDPAAQDFRMSSNSTCIDVADDSLAPPTDFDGESRIDIPNIGTPETLADAGAFEYQP